MILRVPVPSWAMLLVLSLMLSGCGKSSPWKRIALQGTVTVPEISNPEEVNGTLTISPGADNRGPSAITNITAGKYKFDSTNGPVPGNCNVVARIHVPVPPAPGAKPGAKPVYAKPMPGPQGRPVKAAFLPDKTKSIQLPAEKTVQLDLNL